MALAYSLRVMLQTCRDSICSLFHGFPSTLPPVIHGAFLAGRRLETGFIWTRDHSFNELEWFNIAGHVSRGSIQALFASQNHQHQVSHLKSVPIFTQSCSMQSNFDTIRAAICQRQVMSNNWICFQILHLIESLQKSHCYVAGFSESKLLPDADTWSSVELYYKLVY